MKKTVLAASLMLPLAAAYAQGTPLSADEIRTLVTGKILDQPPNPQGVSSNLKIDAGGTGMGSYTSSRGSFSAPLKWQVNDKGEFCTHVQQAGYVEKCTLVQKAQDGNYARMAGGNVDSTFKVR
jgi:hypothetical protein